MRKVFPLEEFFWNTNKEFDAIGTLLPVNNLICLAFSLIVSGKECTELHVEKTRRVFIESLFRWGFQKVLLFLS